MEIRVKRLTPDDGQEAQALFAMMAEIFTEDFVPLSDRYVEQLLRRSEFWALAAFADDVVVGGVTAHTLPMTRNETSELFLYDIAVQTHYQRRGVGRHLLNTLRNLALEAGIRDVFVPADEDDTHALDFYHSLGGKASHVTIFDFPGIVRASDSP